MMATAVEKSRYRQQVDIWFNENVSNAEISRRLREMGEDISDVSIGKYRRYREDFIAAELTEDPITQGKLQTVNQALVDGASKVKEIDVLGHLSTIIEQTSSIIARAVEDPGQIEVKNAQQLRFMQQTMLDSLRLYGDTMATIQKMQAIKKDPELLRPQVINTNVKDVLYDILGGMDANARTRLIDKLRGSAGESEPG
jgi:hypothetical protein